MTDPFSMVKFNANARSDALRRRGVGCEGYGGSFSCDVLFKSTSPGFVVQKVVRTISYTNPRRMATIKKECYWEIFYIGKNGSSYNADRFSQPSRGRRSQGILVQTGQATFYPYDRNVRFDRRGDMVLTKPLQTLFGSHIKLNKVRLANGLPSGQKKPLMKGLASLRHRLRREVQVTWGPAKQSVPFRGGYPSIVGEKTYAGAGVLRKSKLGRPATFKDEAEEARPV